MPPCARCKKPFSMLSTKYKIERTAPSNITKYGVGNYCCFNCWMSLMAEYEQIKKRPRPEITCPFCGQMFSPVTKTPTTTHGNVARGIAFLPWGVVSAMKNKPFVQCPHCQMKIPQG